MYFLISLILKISVTSAALHVQWNRPRVTYNTRNYDGFANDFNEYNALHKVVYFDACGNDILKDRTDPFFRWEFFDTRSWPNASSSTEKEKQDEAKQQLIRRDTSSCQMTWTAPREGSYVVRVSLYDSAKFVEAKDVRVDVADIWVVAIGDSFVSGEGNPDVKAAFLVLPRWIDGKCKRSASGSFAFKTYENIEKTYPKKGILFTFLACSGAATDTGLLGPYLGNPPQVDVVEEIQEGAKGVCCTGCCKTIPDVVILGIGGNDLKFSTVVGSFLVGLGEGQYKQTPGRLEALNKKLSTLAQRFDKMEIPSRRIFYVEYFDPLRDERGSLDSSCKRTGVADDSDFLEVFNNVFAPLNRLMKKKAKENEWNFVDGVDEAFFRHGVCSTDSHIRTIDQSLAMQLDVNGAFHPTYAGHERTAMAVWRYVGPYVKWLHQPRTTAAPSAKAQTKITFSWIRSTTKR